jgi:hypothetical protein
MGTGNLKWIQMNDGTTIEIPFGMIKANFKDEDFHLQNCSKLSTDSPFAMDPLNLIR